MTLYRPGPVTVSLAWEMPVGGSSMCLRESINHWAEGRKQMPPHHTLKT